jgi:hypothetical protein
MRIAVLFLFLFTASFRMDARTPDSTAVAGLFNTSWTLTDKYRISGVFHRKHRLENTSEKSITIYRDEIHSELTTGKYQICSMRHRNVNEFWLDCASPDQYIYRVVSINGDKLVIDVLTRIESTSPYERITRNHYVRKRN